MNERKFGGPSFEPVSKALPLTAREDKQWASLAHFGGIIGFLPALAIYCIYKNRGPFTAQEARGAFNFALPLSFVIFVAMIVSLFIPVDVGLWFVLLAFIVWVFLAVHSIIGGIRSNRGEPYQYPFNFYFVSL